MDGAMAKAKRGGEWSAGTDYGRSIGNQMVLLLTSLLSQRPSLQHSHGLTNAHGRLSQSSWSTLNLPSFLLGSSTQFIAMLKSLPHDKH